MDGKDAEGLRKFLRTFLESADPPDRMVALLHWADGLSATEIGVVLDRSEQDVACRIAALRDAARGVIRSVPLVPV